MGLIAEKIYNYFAALICLLIPFMTYAKASVNILMIALLFLLIFIPKKNNIIKIFKEAYIKTFCLFLLFVLFFSTLNNSLFDDFSETRKIAQTILLIFLFFLVKRKSLLITAFILGILIASLPTVINIICFNYFEIFLWGESINDSYITQRLYLGFFVVLALILSLYRYFNVFFKRSKNKYMLLILYYILALFLIASRSAIIIAFLILVTSIIYNTKGAYRVLFLISIPVIFITIILNSDSLSKRFFHSKDSVTTSIIENIQTHEPRYDIWKFSVQIFDEKRPYLFGIGTYQTQRLLNKKYEGMSREKDKRRQWFIESNFNTHNQYIDLILSYGFLGFLVFIIFLKQIISKVYKNIHSLNLILAIIVFLFVENIFHRQLGSFIFALSIVFAVHLININNEKNFSS